MTHQEAAETLAAERYLLDELSAGDREAFEAHYFSCEECAADLRSTAAMLQGAKEGLAGSETAAAVIPMPLARTGTRPTAWYRSTAIPWAAAAALAAITTYQSVWVVPSLRRAGSPVALAPVLLHPESRGTEATVSVSPEGGPVTLALEVNDSPAAGQITYDLRTQSGRRILSGRAAAPAPGMPLLLLLPAWTVAGEMHYILTVHDAAAAGRSLGEYRFAVSTR
jgi:anti-sigma factor RsiW